ncbi:hypothetical protein [Brachybacterium kimchii]|uniref:Uncharacterized protein n=1 Tax=Brachybacterium kimchii TaxID=2942909 RepID=A0ABY4N7L0_9MICO|nr:hypothetical protein [Brachybacterium kimchii]UQN30543.1 hypothetical protein M4486_04320 [Brachybacterium kimchii]
MELGRGPRFDKDSNDLADFLAKGGVKIALFIILAVFVGSLLLGVIL